MKHRILPLFLFLTTGIPGFASAEGFYNAEAGVRYDNNIGNGQSSPYSASYITPYSTSPGAPYIASDSIFFAAVSAGQSILLNDTDDSLTLHGRLKNESFNRFHGMSNLSLDGSLAFRRKFGMGPYAPWLSASLSLDRMKYGDNIRDGWLQQGGIKGGKRITERWNVWAEYILETRRSDHTEAVNPIISGAVFEQKNRNLSLNMEYAHSDSLFFTLGYGLRTGDVVVTALADLTSLYAVAKAIRPDMALGANQDAYRLDGNTSILNAGLGMTINPRFLLSVNYQRQVTHADGGNNYSKSLSSITGSYNF